MNLDETKSSLIFPTSDRPQEFKQRGTGSSVQLYSSHGLWTHLPDHKWKINSEVQEELGISRTRFFFFFSWRKCCKFFQIGVGLLWWVDPGWVQDTIKAVLSLPSTNGWGEKNIMKVSWVQDQERSLTDYCHKQNRLTLGILIEFYCLQNWTG